MNEDDERTEVLGVTEADFNAWKHHPVTIAFRQYIIDYRRALIDYHLAKWEANVLDEGDDEARGRVIGLQEIAELEFSHIALFYKEPNDEMNEENNGT